MSKHLERLRAQIPADKMKRSGKLKEFFEVLSNNSGLTEEYLYAHQPTGRARIPVYSTNKDPVGYLDDSHDVRLQFDVIAGPAILVARKGYGGRLSIITDNSFIVHEDGYAIRPKTKYIDDIHLGWFSCHYSTEFQGHRSSLEGIGDFPRAKLFAMNIKIPDYEWQSSCYETYKRRDSIVNFIKNSSSLLGDAVNSILSAEGAGEKKL